MRRLPASNNNRETYSGLVLDSHLLLERPLPHTDRLFVGDRFNGCHVELDGFLHGTQLSGASNVGVNEPVFTGDHFVNFAGQKLQVLRLGEPVVYGLPRLVMVLDPAQNKAFVGYMGGRVPPTVSIFHGFDQALATREATAADRHAFKKAKVQLLAERRDEEVCEAWYADAKTGRIYMTLSVFDVTDVMEVIDLPPELAEALVA